MKHMRMVILGLLLFLATGCVTESPLNEEQMKELAWNYLSDDMKGTVIGQKEDLTYVDKDHTGVYTIINNAPVDVWKQSEAKCINENIYSITFRTIFDDVAAPVVIYVDAKQKKVIGQKERRL